MNKRPRVLIVGGGFAGVRCARTLRKRLAPDVCEIILFDRENSMVYYPLLAEVAGATIGPDSVATRHTSASVALAFASSRAKVVASTRGMSQARTQAWVAPARGLG